MIFAKFNAARRRTVGDCQNKLAANGWLSQMMRQILHIAAGYIGGLSYFNLIQKDFTVKSVIRFLACLPLILIFSITTSWIFDPATAAESFGFNFSEISDLGRNTLIRDMTAFFMANAIFYLLGIITLNATWFFASGTIYASAFVFNLMAINFYGTSQNEALIAEAIFTIWSFGIGFWLSKRTKASLTINKIFK